MTPFDPREILSVLVEHEVDFLVIGGVAVIAQGFVRATKDLDICCERGMDNLTKLGKALQQMHARLRGAEDVPIPLDARFLRNMSILTFSTDRGDFDCLAEPDGSRAYADMKASAIRVEVRGHSVLVASIEDLLRMKRAAGRPQDERDIEALEVVLRLQREEST